jgi:hypothetical protein
LELCSEPSERCDLQHHGLHVPCFVPHARDLEYQDWLGKHCRAVEMRSKRADLVRKLIA